MKKLLNRKQKGFTIVELVIVIAVIGILAGVLIPVFINLNNKANKAADEALVKNLNTALATQEQEPGDTKNATFHDAVVDLKEYGYLLPNLVAKSDEDLLWDRETNRFLLEEDAESDKTLNYWRIQNNLDEQKFNIYAGPKFAVTGNAISNLKVGFDAGDFEGLESISYVGNGETAQTVVIRSNSAETALTVNAPLDTVHHYDLLDDLTVTAVAGASYHEHGIVRGKATVSQGHFAIEKTGEVPQIDVKTATGAVKVTANAATLVNVDSASASQASVIANSKDVYVTGVSADKISGSEKDAVELPTVVSNEAQLASAITTKKAFIQIGANFIANDIYEFNYKAMLDFAGFTITATRIGTSQADYKNAIQNMTPEFAFVNTPFITNKSNLTIADTKGNGGITSSNNIIINNTSKLVFNGGKLNSTLLIDKYYSGRNGLDADSAENTYRNNLNATILRGVLYNGAEGTLTFNDGTIEVTSDYAFLNSGNAVFNGGNIISHSDNALGGYGYAFSQKDGNITVNYVHINAVHGAFGFNGGKAVVNDALVDFASSGNKFYAFYIAGEYGYPEVVINGGTYNKGGSNVMYVGNKNDGGAGNLAMANVYGGTFNGGIYAELTSANNYGIGMLRLYGGSYKTTLNTHLIADGYRTVQNGDYQVVVKQ